MKKMLGKIPTEKKIDMLLDKGYDVEIYMRGGEVVVETIPKS